MLKAYHGLILATGMLSLPLFAQADCPPEDSIDRYAQTASDALTALHELVPESQQQALEDRYAAMIMLKWQWQGRDAISADPVAMTQVLNCYQQAGCGIRTNDPVRTDLIPQLEAEVEVDPLILQSLLPQQPSPRSMTWAERTLGCGAYAPAPLPDQTEPLEVVADTSTDAVSERPLNTAEAAQSLPPALTPSLPERVQPAAIEAASSTIETNEAPTTIEVADRVAPEQTAPVEDAVTKPVATARIASGDASKLLLNATMLVAAGKPHLAFEPLETACFIEAKESQASQACDTLISVYMSGVAPANFDTGAAAILDLSQRLCAAEYSQGCNALSQHYETQNSVEANRAAVSFAEKSCALQNADACATVSGYYLEGRTDAPDPIAAREHLEMSCRLGRLSSCQSVADLYLRGIGGAPDTVMALQMVDASCPSGSADRADLCVSAADFVLINESFGEERSARVRTYIKRACEIGHDVGCAWYAEDLELGIGGAVDLHAARKARLTACEYGDQESCNSRS
ncbi:MAG: tetratricopeptide repeat protein [Pseudomonadota bacterium]